MGKRGRVRSVWVGGGGVDPQGAGGAAWRQPPRQIEGSCAVVWGTHVGAMALVQVILSVGFPN